MIKVTCAIIIEAGKILAAQNNESSDHPFQWEFPGGKIKRGETERECIVREIKEELSLTVEVAGELMPIEHDYKIKAIRLIPFVCIIKSGKLKLNDHLAVKWLGFEELAKLDWAEADRCLLTKKENLQLLKEYLGK
ncbi:(deoxy)nucleoside triphosphate pyrophosphohydrolase [Draconibacterium sp. IB214405]|uniref:(deoxy)nucleoside triphosphate pyrophosphohydrolase n=1 Tax=Draconibacterium sp. IB214405 TaxID=3097352 RepID=UPI002A177D94|nr:(deoxy)nucleoside triphosphate pyrophosphohydrolase [Draconibacterium sp. IB214405]MDX8338439.1 (deoxy)nucleoside triphosphate pyrophosphohydrolase [Draconibacterium sp. IB214405]